MRFEDYQDEVRTLAHDSETTDVLVPILGLGAHVGGILSAHYLYLRDALDAPIHRDLLGQDLGRLLRQCALTAIAFDLSLSEIATANLQKVRLRSASAGRGIPEHLPNTVTVDSYQFLATHSDLQATVGMDPLMLGVPILGLAGEAGSLLVAMKKKYRGDSLEVDWPTFVGTEIGDLLWYGSTMATHAGLELEKVLIADIESQKEGRLPSSVLASEWNALPLFDSAFPATERFPRRMIVRFHQRQVAGQPLVKISLVAAEPNAFPEGPVARDKKKVQGFQVGAQFGAEVDDNSGASDGYRFHDAIHFGLLAVLGWSPNMRSLLNIKRKSDSRVDSEEDGARAVFAEEGLAAVLAKRAIRHQDFRSEASVDDETLEILQTVLEDLEVGVMPRWIWRRAVNQAFVAYSQLVREGGGFLSLDLDDRSLTYSKTPPR